LATGRLDATDAEVMEAARKANAYDFIMSFDDKFETCARTPNSGSGFVSSR